MKTYFLTAMMCVAAVLVSGQDIHFSQFSEMPLLRNPALAGVFDGSYRVQAIYRNQWVTVSPQPYQTTAAGIEYKLKESCDGVDDAAPTTWVVGLQFLKDVAGASNFTRNEVAVSFTGRKRINDNLRVASGFFGGYVTGGFDAYKLSWGDQYVNYQYSPNNPTAQPFGNKGKNYFDVGLGVMLTNASSDKSWQWYCGAAAYHINKPVISYGEDYTMPVRFSINASSASYLGENDNLLIFTGDAILQKNQREYLFGAYYKINGFGWDNFASGNKQGFSITPGIIYRAQDALILALKLEWNHITVGVSFDVNVIASNISEASGGYGAYEGLIKYRGTLSDMGRCGGYECPFQ
ncbi:MAG TPA: PorP/SprF family type IX secretion system membrane protein [Chitinophagaceae bacterium]|nr:PorP/SprF family type IX secretion system membrane protein [Chitinophagaceae bacterium]